jgi:hypothetical protein
LNDGFSPISGGNFGNSQRAIFSIPVNKPSD